LGAGLGFLHPQITDYADFLRRGRCAGLFNLKRAVEPSTLFGFWFQGFMVSSKSGSGSLSGSIV
ncbi:MAG: hypothetical protein KBI41_10235, partial [Kiritimatiellae bacterium]|nr:hypothetical protein [Kiritimatiellia bacterium]